MRLNSPRFKMCLPYLRTLRWHLVPLLALIIISAFRSSYLITELTNHQPVPLNQFVNFESGHVHPVDLTPNGKKLLAVNTANNTLEVFNIVGDSLFHTKSIPVGMDPVSVRVLDNAQAWVANIISDNVSIVDLNQEVVIRTLQTENEPADIVFAGSPLRAFVSCAERESIQIFDLANLDATPQEVLLIGEQPKAMAVSPDGNTVYTAFFESGNQTTVINGSASVTAGLTSPQGGTTAIPNDVANPAGPYGGVLPVPNNGTGFNPAMNPSLPTDISTQSLVVRKDAQNRWMDDNGGDWTNIVSGGAGVRQAGWDLKDRDVAILNANNLTLSYQNHLGNILMAMGVNPATGKVSVVGTDATNEIRFEPNLNGVFLRVNISQFNPGNASNNILDLNPHLNYSTSSVPVSERQKSIGDPRGIAWKSDGSKAYITGMGSNNVITIDPNGNRLNPQPILVGEGPTGIAIDENKSKVYVLNRFDASVSVIDMNTDQEILRKAFFDPTPQEIRTGRKHLYNTHLGSGNGHIACASCHVDGKWDRLGWDLGNPAGEMETVNGRTFHPLKGLKTTQPLIDIIGKGDGLLHWRGDRSSFADFAGAFNHLQGTDAPLDNIGMQEFEDFLISTYHPPSPYRPFRPVTDVATSRMNPDKIRGPGTTFQPIQTIGAIFNTMDVNCNNCHLPHTGRGPANYAGNDNISADLRSTYRKLGFYYNSVESTAGFGLLSDGVMETWFNQQGVVDYLGDYQQEVMGWTGGVDFTNNPGSGQLAGVHSSQHSHPAVGMQATINGSIGTTAEVSNLVNMVNDFNTELGLIVKGIFQGEKRGFYRINGTSSYQSDSAAQTVTHNQLLTAAQSGEPLTWMIVHKQIEERAGVDRNANGIFDKEEVLQAHFIADRTQAFPLPAEINFDAASSQIPVGSTVTYAWDFGDGNTGNGISPTHTYAFADSFDVVLSVTDLGTGETSTTVKQIITGESIDVFPTLDTDKDNDGIPDDGEKTPTLPFAVTSNPFNLPQLGGNATQLVNLSSQGAQIGQKVNLSNLVADGDLNGSTETFTLNINSGEFIKTGLQTGLQCNGSLVPVTTIFSSEVTVIDIGGGVPGISILGQTTTDVNDLAACVAVTYQLNIEGGSAGIIVSDQDGDGITNILDLDSDNDGIWDVIEAGGTDTDLDAFIDDLTQQATLTNPPDTDGDGLPDFLDIESTNPLNDGSGPFDIASTAFAAFDTDGDGMITANDTGGGTDGDQDGLDDLIDGNLQKKGSGQSGDCFVESGGEVIIEAENYFETFAGSGSASGSSWQTYTDATASEGSAVRAVPNTGAWTGLNLNGPRLDYKVNFVETGTYNVYVRSSAPGPNDDSYHAGLNGIAVTNLSGNGMKINGPWDWADDANDGGQVQIEVASAGMHIFNIWMREDGVQIDKIVLSKVNVPTGNGPDESSKNNCDDPGNQPPIASFTATPDSGAAPLQVSLDAAASADHEGPIATYTWDFGDGNTASGVTASHTFNSDGQFTVTLTVTDQDGLTASSSSLIKVSPAGGPVCFVESGGEVIIEAENYSQAIAGTGNASGSSWQTYVDATTSDGSAIRAVPNTGVWTGLNLNGPRLDYHINFSTTGTYQVYVRSSAPGANDDSYHAGLNGIALTNTSGFGMDINGSWDWASDANGGIPVELVISSTGMHTFNLWMREDGVQIDKIVLTQLNGPTGTGPVESTEGSCGTGSNQAPTASFTATPTTGIAPLQLSLDASASSDPEGPIASYDWDFGDGNTASGQTNSHTYLTDGQYTITLTVTDQDGLSGTSNQIITVDPANGPLCFTETNGLVVLEAENYSNTVAGTGSANGNNWQSFTDATASGNAGVQAMPNLGNWTGLNLNGPRLDYEITFNTAGTYFVYIRSAGAGSADDSYHAGLNGSAVTNSSGFGMDNNGLWKWVDDANGGNPVQIVVPSTGQHTFNIWMREDGVQIDKIVLKLAAGKPVDFGPAESTQNPCSEQSSQSFAVEEDSGNAEIDWGNFYQTFMDWQVLERSFDGVTYEILTQQEIEVDKTIFNFTDPDIDRIGASRIYYRLRIMDAHGNTKNTREGILDLTAAEILFSIHAYPNPAVNSLIVEFDDPSQTAWGIRAMNLQGQAVFEETNLTHYIDGRMRMDVSNWARGVYYIQLYNGQKSEAVRIRLQ